DIDDEMGATLVEAEAELPAVALGVERDAPPAAERHAGERGDRGGDAAMAESLDHHLALPRCIKLVRHVLGHAAAAGAEMHASRIGARRMGTQQKAAPALAHAPPLSGQREGHIEKSACSLGNTV